MIDERRVYVRMRRGEGWHLMADDRFTWCGLPLVIDYLAKRRLRTRRPVCPICEHSWHRAWGPRP